MAALRRFRLALCAYLLVAGMGVAGYVAIEGWPAFDALYMTVITLTTVGFMEVRPLGDAGRAFTLILIACGLVAGSVLAATFLEVVLGEILRQSLRKRRMETEIKGRSGHYLICGWGRMGQEITDQFRAARVAFVVIDTSEEKCRRMGEVGICHVHGDATDDAVLRQAGVERAKGLITVAPRDADNIFITLSARALNPGLYIVARSIYDQDVRKLEIAGANRVLSPYKLGARRIAAAALRPTVVDFLELALHCEELEWELDDVPVTEEAWFAGRSIRDSKIRERTGCTILAIKPAGTHGFRSNPEPETVLHPGDILVTLGTADQLDRLEALVEIPPADRRTRALRRR